MTIFRYPFNRFGVSEGWRRVRWAFQRAFRGYDNGAHWDLGYYLTEIILPSLRVIRETKGGVPLLDGYTLDDSPERTDEMCYEWDRILGLMIRAFQLMHDEDHSNRFLNGSETDEVRKGLALFARYYRSLWT